MSETTPSEQPRPLEFASMDELFEEIAARTRDAILIVSKPPIVKSYDGDDQFIWFSNGVISALGLLDLGKVYVRSMRFNRRPRNPGADGEFAPDPDAVEDEEGDEEV